MLSRPSTGSSVGTFLAEYRGRTDSTADRLLIPGWYFLPAASFPPCAHLPDTERMRTVYGRVRDPGRCPPWQWATLGTWNRVMSPHLPSTECASAPFTGQWQPRRAVSSFFCFPSPLFPEVPCPVWPQHPPWRNIKRTRPPTRIHTTQFSHIAITSCFRHTRVFCILRAGVGRVARPVAQMVARRRDSETGLSRIEEAASEFRRILFKPEDYFHQHMPCIAVPLPASTQNAKR